MNEEVVLLFEEWYKKYAPETFNFDRFDFGFKGYKDKRVSAMYYAFLNGWRVNNVVKDNT